MDSLVVWSGVMIACIVVEILTVSLVSVWFVIGAFAALIACLLNVSVPIQVAIFLVVSVICTIVARPMAVKSLKGNIIHTNNDALIGSHALVIKRIDADHMGEVRIKNQIWSASSLHNLTLEEGEYGEVVAIEGAHLVVKKEGN